MPTSTNSSRDGPGVGAAGEPYLPPAERDELLRDLEKCDEEMQQARKGDQDKDRELLLISLERGLHLRRRLYAESSPEVTSACRRLCEACNFAATRMLQTDNVKGAFDLLKRAEQVADKSDVDRAITWNNMAVYYRRAGKLRTAVTFLERALVIEEHLGTANVAQTHLNLCATLSQLQRHTDALLHAQTALIRIYETLSPAMINGELAHVGGSFSSGTPHSEQDEEEEEAEDGGEGLQEQVSVLCIAYHNLAVEHEYLKRFDAALCAYASGMRWANRFLSSNHTLREILRESAETVKAKLPRGSGALKRADELSAGFPSTASRRGSAPSEGGSTDLHGLMAPRGGDASAEADIHDDEDRDN
mmetsp:Transcript_99937/g.287221  ORF Transcript_99937/g.287221 Transcript_99937/m.287221 type:complete len:361 (+) Transcript_99937:81-1163(+)|eukprot:CAMPEP_0170240702 /NCGR_PEP_ID=MMETSP0116_2-20130129/20113_1 /TAXON_ID=400756 /ORGANISM="Durinskia baltica, Strain CSIRO CS-38" /LENGTH=360 /DNA_ID=CAMNT_0010491529 /DNA_START=81 /DNA_END=1163 /DNA_ORIENTATION=-